MSDDGSGSFIDDDSLNDFSDFSGGEGQVRGLEYGLRVKGSRGGKKKMQCNW